MYKKVFLPILLLCLLQIDGFAQKTIEAFHPMGQVSIGKIDNTDVEIAAHCYDFFKDVTGIITSPTSELNLVQVNGKTLACKLDSAQTLWTVKKIGDIMFQTNTNTFLIVNRQGVYSWINCYSMLDGKKLWSRKKGYFLPLCEVENSDLLLAADHYTLKGIDANNGSTVWKRKLKDRDAVDPFSVMLDDNTLLLITGGIHTVNLQTGEGWSYEVKTGDKSLKKAIVQQAFTTLTAGAAGMGIGMVGVQIGVNPNFALQGVARVMREAAPYGLPYGSALLEDNTITYSNDEEAVKLSLTDGSVISQEKFDNKSNKEEEKNTAIPDYILYNNLKFKQNKESVEVYRNDNIVATLSIENILFFDNNILYASNNKMLYKIDLNQLN